MPKLLMVNKLVRRYLGWMVFDHRQCVGLTTRRSGNAGAQLGWVRKWAVPPVLRYHRRCEHGDGPRFLDWFGHLPYIERDRGCALPKTGGEKH